MIYSRTAPKTLLRLQGMPVAISTHKKQRKKETTMDLAGLGCMFTCSNGCGAAPAAAAARKKQGGEDHFVQSVSARSAKSEKSLILDASGWSVFSCLRWFKKMNKRANASAAVLLFFFFFLFNSPLSSSHPLSTNPILPHTYQQPPPATSSDPVAFPPR